MGIQVLNNPLATVQLIPIYGYLNILSDVLFVENYLTKKNQTKRIPIINALYEYLEDHKSAVLEGHYSMKETLIQKLLKGSDLYGEKEGELFDTTFGNTVFDYIISSVVFEKYGNIFGFLATVVRNVDNLQVNYVLEKTKESLKISKFENNHGEVTQLSHLAINRVFNDMILPLFPQTKNMSILSLDYMLAQAGAMYLRLGRLNNTYNLRPMKKENSNPGKGTFDEYLIVGHVLYSLLTNYKMDPLTYRTFVLPVLFHYVTSENAVTIQNITSLIFSPERLGAAYAKFISHTQDFFNRIEVHLSNDNTYKMHRAFTKFENHAMIANFVLNSRCFFISEHVRKTRIPVYLEFADDFECARGDTLPNINELYQNQLHNIGELYARHDLENMNQLSSEFPSSQEFRGAVIKLIEPDMVLNNTKKLPFDFLEFQFSNNSEEYYVLKRENYKLTLVRQSDTENFNKILGLHKESLIQLGDRITLKFSNETKNDFYRELVQYKKGRLRMYLNYSDDNFKKLEWWKEFGLSLILFYPCLTNNKDYQIDDENKFCQQDDIKFLNKFPEDVSLYLVNKNTDSFLSSIGTTVRTVFTKHRIHKMMDKSIFLDESYYDMYEELSSHLEEPKFETMSITHTGIRYVRAIINDLRMNTGYNFVFTETTLNEMEYLLQSNHTKYVRDFGEQKQSLLVKTLDSSTGYGYKFVMIPDSEYKTAELRTGYDFKDEMLVALCKNSTENQKIYFKLNNMGLYESNYVLYEINGQLKRKAKKFSFSSISMQHDDKCEDAGLETTENGNACRARRFVEMINYMMTTERFLKQQALNKNISITEKEIRDKLRKYILMNDDISLKYFSSHWLDEKFEESDWCKYNVINQPELLRKLMYNITLDDIISVYYDEDRIDSLYPYRERCEIEKEAPLEDIVKNYNDQKARFAVTFEDYYAIRNFATNGENRITANTNEARRMKMALYKLAVRQFEDLTQELDSKLYRVESRPINYLNRLFKVGEKITFERFTSAALSASSAVSLAAYPATGFRNILYEIEIVGPYMRAEIELFENSPTKWVILLPGIQFEIKDITYVNNIGGIGSAEKVVLSTKFYSDLKQEWYKHVMSEISTIEL